MYLFNCLHSTGQVYIGRHNFITIALFEIKGGSRKDRKGLFVHHGIMEANAYTRRIPLSQSPVD